MRWCLAVAVGAFLAALAVEPVLAHGSSLSGGRETVTLPTWLFLGTGGAAVGASFLLASLVTDRALIDAIHGWRRAGQFPAARAVTLLVRALGVVLLAGVLAVAFLGPARGRANAALLFVWVGWWAGYTMTTYLLGSSWGALNPWRTVASALPSMERSAPDRLGAWPSVVGLLALIYVEVVSPLASDPRLLGTAILAYSVVTLAGAVVVGPETYFDRIDPVSRVFRFYGRLAPLSRTDDGIELRLPGAALSERKLVDGFDDVGFVIALLWGTTFDGFVATGGWAAVVEPVVEAGVPPLVAYLGVLAGGYLAFLWIYWSAGRYSRRFAPTYLSPGTLALRFAPPLLAIAAGYHLAHYLDYFLRLAPALVTTAVTPLTLLSTVPVLALPGWFDGVALVSVLLGHVVAIWAAHAAAFEAFPGRLQAIRSQYPYIVVMVLYTISSLWIVAQPTVAPPYV